MHMKILRLSLFNLKKNKREALSVMFLTAITMFLIGIAVCNITKVNTVFDETFAATESVENMVMFPEEKYRKEYKSILENDDRVSRVEEVDLLINMRAAYKKEDSEVGFIFACISENEEKKIEKFEPKTNLTEDEIDNLTHPIWLPVCFQYSMDFEVGNPFVLMLSGKEYPFEIAGFYESGLMAYSGSGYKCVISEADYQLLSMVMDEKKVMVFDCEESFLHTEYLDMCTEQSSENIGQFCCIFTKETTKSATTMFITLYLYFLVAVAFITMIACLFMIRHKISNDIEDQMQAIGVLEALGYKSKEISLAYVYEYVLTGGIGAVIGILLVLLSDPLLNNIIEVMIGYRVYGSVNLGIQFGIMCILVLISVLSALGKAKTVKKFPPVVAFRKGISSHHFGKNYLPLSKAKGNINLRLSMKELLGNAKSSMGIMMCIFATATAILCGFYMFDYLKEGVTAIIPVAGLEMGDVRVELVNGVDPYEFQETLMELPEVRKTLVTYPDYIVNAKDKNGESYVAYTVVVDDFKETENLFLMEGRYPEHENEIMITLEIANRKGFSVGDSMVVEGDTIDKSYVITGIVNSLSNGGQNIYITSEGLKNAFPAENPKVLEIYLNEDIDRHEFSDKLTALYGGSVENTLKEDGVTGNYEDKIRQVADEKMARLISLYGITDVDYSIKIGDRVISGNSEKFILRDVSSTLDLLEGQLGPIAVGMKAISLVIAGCSVIVATVILSVLAGTTVRRKRKDLGIMKAMGYTSKDLMQQITFRIMPIAGVAVVLASAVSVYLMRAFGLTFFGVVLDVNFWIMVPVDICLLIFFYLVTYISAGKTKEISATELMTE